MSIPDWWEALLLSLAAWRVFHLLVADDLLETPRRYVTERVSDYWEDFITCPYCSGAWIALGWWIAWQIWPEETLISAIPFVLSAGVVGAAKVLSSD